MAKPIVNKKPEKRNLIILIIILVIIFIINVYFLFNNKIIEIRKFYSSVIVSDKIGFDLNSTAVTFGGVTPGGSSMRTLILENTYDFKISVYAYGEGEIRRFIRPVKEIVNPGETMKMGISVSIPENASFGEYGGEIIVRIKRA